MTAAEKQLALTALQQFTRDTSTITPDSIRTLCQAILDITNYFIQADSLKTASNGESNPANADFHYGALDPSTGAIHIEPWLLLDAQTNNKARWELAGC